MVHAAGSETLKIGLIGCGGRGTGAAAQALKADKGVVLTAMGDAVDDRLQKSLGTIKKQFGYRVQVTPDRCFTGLANHKGVIDSGVDIVLLCSPPGFRPMQIEYAVQKGKHIFTEKPMATDAAGVHSLIKSVEEAKKKNLMVVAGFNGRYSPVAQEMFSRLQGGAIGDIQGMYTTFNTGYLWNWGRKPEWSDMEWQVRNWYYFTWLSGDHLVEQAVHNVDRLAWAMKDTMPAKAVAFGGRQVRVEPQWGHIYDHFAVVYEWASGTQAYLFCRQQENCANDVSDHYMGTKGTADMGGRAGHIIKGENAWQGAKEPVDSHQLEHDAMYAAMRAGKTINDGDRMINSTMMAIMGRMAAYTGKIVTWDQAINSQENLMPEKLEWGPIAIPPVAMPGRTKLV
jgi:predicted dehydrogenase